MKLIAVHECLEEQISVLLTACTPAHENSSQWHDTIKQNANYLPLHDTEAPFSYHYPQAE